MSVDWFRVESTLVDHPKLDVLEARLGPGALKILMRVWSWAARLRREGVFLAGEIDLAAKCEAAVALVEAGFVEADGLTLHDWHYHNGQHLERLAHKRKGTAERVRRHRERLTTTPTTTPTATATATATGNALHPPLQNALQDDKCNALHKSTNRDNHLGPTGLNGEYGIAYQEYRNFCGGVDGQQAFEKWMQACVTKRVTVLQVMEWLRANPGSHVHEARDALVSRPARPPTPGSEEAERAERAERNRKRAAIAEGKA